MGVLCGAAVAMALMAPMAAASGGPARSQEASAQRVSLAGDDLAFGQASPGQDVPGQPAPGQSTPAQAPPAQVPPVTPPVSRTFTAPVGLLFNTVRADRVADFEKVIAYLQQALEKSSDPTIRAQAKGWRVFKASEPGPNGTVLYVFGFNPTVPGADYGLGRILADAYPDTAQLQQIWSLYQGAVTGGGSLLNLTPVTPVVPPPLPAAQPPSPDADPPQRP